VRRLDEHSIEMARREGWSSVRVGWAYRTGPKGDWDDQALISVEHLDAVEHIRGLTTLPKLRRVELCLPELSGSAMASCVALLSNVPELKLTVLGAEQARALHALPDAVELSLRRGRSDAELWATTISELWATLARMPGLVRLGLNGTVIDARRLAQLRHLRELEIDGVGFSHVHVLRGLRLRRFSGRNLPDTTATLAELAAMGTMVKLALTDCAVTDDMLPTVAKASGLEVLRLSDNAIQGHGLAALADLSLHTLDLSRNPVGASLNHLLGVPTLRTLDLRSVDLRSESCEVLAGMERLVDLNLNRTRVGQRVAPLLRRMRGLEVLRIATCDVADASFVSSLPRLRVLDLENNREFSGLDAEDVRELSELRDLNLRFNTRTGVRFIAALSALPQLESLNLVVCNLVPDHVRELARSTSLRRLKLSGNDLGDVGMRALAPMTELALLDVPDCKVSDVGAEALAEHLTHLRYLGISGNQLTDVGAAAVLRLGRLLWLDAEENRIERVDLLLPGGHLRIDDQVLTTPAPVPRPCFIAEIDEQLERAFDGVPVPPPSSRTLYQAQAEDGHEASDRSRDHIGRWQDIPLSHFADCQSALPYLDAHGMRYYLPAIIRNELNAQLEPTGQWDHRYDSLEYYLTPSGSYRDLHMERLALLDVRQRAAIAAWVHGTQGDSGIRDAWKRVVEHDASGSPGHWFDAYWPPQPG